MERRVRALLERPDVRRARTRLFEDDERTLSEQRELTEIPAPPYGEERRAERMAEIFDDAGLEKVETDREGNVLGRHGGGGPPVVVSAHLDTVFPAGTDVRVRQVGDRLVGPGISDDGRGLAALAALGRAVVDAGVEPPGPLLFVATVGEEGSGDLRGVRHLFREGGPARDAAGFVSLDGAGLARIVNGGLGSRRFRMVVQGPGGHSWVDWGTPNPIHALGRAVGALVELELPDSPPTTLTVARWAGGTSINAIPREAWVELEVRSASPGHLDAVEEAVKERVREALRRENRSADAGGDVTLEVQIIGDRPPGGTSAEACLVRAAVAATRSVGVEPELAVSSTDANVPMTLGVPAITMGAGGEAGQAHTPDEWYRNEAGPEGILRALLTVLAACGDGR